MPASDASGFVSSGTVGRSIPFEELEPAATTARSGIADRIDPFWGELWTTSEGGVAVSWDSRRSFERLAAHGLLHPRGRTGALSKEDALARVPERRPRLEALAAINMWRAITSEQLAAFTGYPGVGTGRSAMATTRLLWAAGLIQRGTFIAAGKRIATLPPVFRPGTKGCMDRLEPLLGYHDWVGVTGGQAQPFGHHYDRHNLLTTELSLRAAELCPLAAVMGEGLAAWSLVFDPSAGVPESSHRAADAVWVRSDGLKIAVETAATVSESTKEKIQQAAEFLAADRSRSTVILFVNAAHPQRGSTFSRIGAQLRMAIAKAAYSSRATIAAGVPERMAVARWVDWFPDPGMVTPSFMALTAQRPTGPTAGEGRFEPVDLLDPFALPFAGAQDPDSVALLSNVHLLYGVPHWQRRHPDTSVLDTRLLDYFKVPQQLRRTPEQAEYLAVTKQQASRVRHDRRMG